MDFLAFILPGRSRTRVYNRGMYKRSDRALRNSREFKSEVKIARDSAIAFASASRFMRVPSHADKYSTTPKTAKETKYPRRRRAVASNKRRRLRADLGRIKPDAVFGSKAPTALRQREINFLSFSPSFPIRDSNRRPFRAHLSSRPRSTAPSMNDHERSHNASRRHLSWRERRFCAFDAPRKSNHNRPTSREPFLPRRRVQIRDQSRDTIRRFQRSPTTRESFLADDARERIPKKLD